MTHIGNSPAQRTVLRVEARKSFTLGVHITDPHGRAVDLTGCQLTIVAKDPRSKEPSDADNLLLADAEARIDNPERGYGRFDLQASTLNHRPGEYPFVIVLLTANGYSSVLVKGILDLQDNTEFSSVFETFSDEVASQHLDVVLRRANVVQVSLGSQPPPGMRYLRDEDAETIENFDPDSIAMVPPGGLRGYVLTKTNTSDYSMAWRPVGNGVFALNAMEQPAGVTPVANGDGTWDWSTALSAAGAAAGEVPVAAGDGTWAWEEQSGTGQGGADWQAGPGDDGYIANKPELGTAAAKDAEDFLDAGTMLSQIEGFHIVTQVPETGIDGHLYFVIEPS